MRQSLPTFAALLVTATLTTACHRHKANADVDAVAAPVAPPASSAIAVDDSVAPTEDALRAVADASWVAPGTDMAAAHTDWVRPRILSLQRDNCMHDENRHLWTCLVTIRVTRDLHDPYPDTSRTDLRLRHAADGRWVRA